MTRLPPVLVLPYHDPGGEMFPHLLRVLPDLQAIFARACLGVTPATAAAQPDQVAWLEANPFFACLRLPPATVGVQFHALYAFAAESSDPDAVLHLAFIDRLVTILQSNHRAAFLQDIAALLPDETPLIFQRSAAAWASHPRNYADMEALVTRAGLHLFGRELDFAWCHLVIRAARLRQVLAHTGATDMSLMAEMVLQIRDDVRTRDVDWLAWEDPFLLGRDPAALKLEREGSPDETRKRLGYALPMLGRLLEDGK
jgi:hypothetical protein